MCVIVQQSRGLRPNRGVSLMRDQRPPTTVDQTDQSWMLMFLIFGKTNFIWWYRAQKCVDDYFAMSLLHKTKTSCHFNTTSLKNFHEWWLLAKWNWKLLKELNCHLAIWRVTVQRKIFSLGWRRQPLHACVCNDTFWKMIDYSGCMH